MSLPDPVERALESHEAFSIRERQPSARIDSESDSDVPDGYELETTVFETHVTAREADGRRDGVFELTVLLPTLDAAVADEVVAPVVEDGWFETLERRLEDTFTVAHTSTHEAPTVERDGDEVRVHLEYTAWDAREGVDDAKALIEYVEGTFAQGIIPGYEYRGPAATLLESAQARGQL